MSNLTQIEAVIEETLRGTHPEVDLLDVGIVRGDTLRLVIDHPDGVDHNLCASVTNALDPTGLRDRYGVEVWSPGPQRPLRTIEHYAAAVGERVRLRLDPRRDAEGRRSVSGTLLAADGTAVRIRLGDDEVEVPMAAIRRAHRRVEEES